MPRSFALGAHFEALIDALVQGGRYNNASEVVRAGLRLLEDQEAKRQHFVAEIRASIGENERAGVFVEADAVNRPSHEAGPLASCQAATGKPGAVQSRAAARS